MYSVCGPTAEQQTGGDGDVRQLLGDVGGTHLRLAWCTPDDLTPRGVRVLPTAGFAHLVQAIDHYLADLPGPRPIQAALALANPVLGDRIQMTNHAWTFSAADLRAALRLQRLTLLNDFAALALALPSLTETERWCLPGNRGAHGPREPSFAGPVGLLGPGTGLGVSALIPDGLGAHIPLATEGGHVTLAAQTPEEFAVVQHLKRQFGHASAERVLSGPGLVNLHAALAAIRGERFEAPGLTAADIADRALGPQPDPHCVATLRLFARFLGQTAGNLALTLGARDGIWVGGGIPARWGRPWWAASGFRDAFESKGRFRAYLADIPVWFIDTSEPVALRGAAQALNRQHPAIDRG